MTSEPQPAPAAQRTTEGVRRMFDRVAPRYDLANTVFSLGQDRGWRQAAARATRLAAGELAVDVACGTGALTRELAVLAPEALVAGFDFSKEMLLRARSTVGAPGGPTDLGTPPGFPGPLRPPIWSATRCGCRCGTPRSTW